MNRKFFVNTLLTAFLALSISGCSSLQESLSAQMEVPTLENQANRVAIGLAIVRENNIMAYKIPISSDASWPKKISQELDDAKKSFIEKALKSDPYFATLHYTKVIQRKMLGSGFLMNQLGSIGTLSAMALDKSVSPLTYTAFAKLSILYGKDEKKWPNIFRFEKINDGFLDFKGGTLIEIDSPDGDVYETLGDAVISLAPVSLQKDLQSSREDMLDAFDETASLEADKGDYETELKTDEAKVKNRTKGYTRLSKSQKAEIRSELAVLEQQIKKVESLADEKEAIYFDLLDKSIVALESDINLDDENYVKLAKNINIVANEIDSGATQAYTAFGLAFTNLVSSNAMLNFPNELASLGIAKARVPMHLQSKYNKRIERVIKNSIFILPNIFIGTYYASKQASLAQKYSDFTDVILEAYEVSSQQNKAEDKE